jgi:flagellar basal body-associated protein FliL
MNDNMTPASGSGGIKGLLPVIAIVLGVLNTAALGYGIYSVQKFFKSMDEKQAVAEKDTEDEEETEDGEEVEEEVPAGPILAIDPFVANLNEPGTSRYLRTTFELEMVDQAAIDAFNKNKSKTRNKVLTYLASLSVAETRGEKNLEKIRRDVIQRINEELGGEEKVLNLFFKDFVVQ